MGCGGGAGAAFLSGAPNQAPLGVSVSHAGNSRNPIPEIRNSEPWTRNPTPGAPLPEVPIHPYTPIPPHLTTLRPYTPPPLRPCTLLPLHTPHTPTSSWEQQEVSRNRGSYPKPGRRSTDRGIRTPKPETRNTKFRIGSLTLGCSHLGTAGGENELRGNFSKFRLPNTEHRTKDPSTETRNPQPESGTHDTEHKSLGPRNNKSDNLEPRNRKRTWILGSLKPAPCTLHPAPCTLHIAP